MVLFSILFEHLFFLKVPLREWKAGKALVFPKEGDDMVGNPHRAQVSQFELLERKYIRKHTQQIRASRVYRLVEIRQTVPCRAIRGKSSDSRRQYISQQYPPPLLPRTPSSSATRPVASPSRSWRWWTSASGFPCARRSHKTLKP